MKHGQIAEYGQVKNEHFSKVTLIESRVNGRREYTLNHHDAGWECAGSMARYNAHEVWSVLFDVNGATNGRRFLKESEARSLFDKWTMPEEEQRMIDAQIVRDEINKEYPKHA